MNFITYPSVCIATKKFVTKQLNSKCDKKELTNLYNSNINFFFKIGRPKINVDVIYVRFLYYTEIQQNLKKCKKVFVNFHKL